MANPLAWWLYPVTNPHNPPSERGIDLGMPVGTPIYAPFGGTVLAPYDQANHAAVNGSDVFAQTGYRAWGGEVDLASAVPGLGNVVQYFFHLDQLLVQPGQRILPGQLIGYSGGENTLGQGPIQPGYTPTHTAGAQFSSGPHIEWGFYQQVGSNGWHQVFDPTSLLAQLRQTGMATSGAPPPGTTGTTLLASTSGNGNLLDPATWVADIKSGFTETAQRTGLAFFGGLLLLVGVIVLFFSSGAAEHVEQGAQSAAKVAEVAAA